MHWKHFNIRSAIKRTVQGLTESNVNTVGPVSCENGDPPKWGSWVPILPGKWGPPVWQTIFWEFRDPQCDAGLSTSITMNNMLKQ